MSALRERVAEAVRDAESRWDHRQMIDYACPGEPSSMQADAAIAVVLAEIDAELQRRIAAATEACAAAGTILQEQRHTGKKIALEGLQHYICTLANGTG